MKFNALFLSLIFSVFSALSLSNAEENPQKKLEHITVSSNAYVEVFSPQGTVNEKIGDSHAIISWNPKKGKYTLSLVDTQNRIIDAVEFEVRGSIF